MDKKLSRKEANQEVILMARRMAKLYISFCKTIIEEMGEEKGKKLIKESIMSYGEDCGKKVREEVQKKGLPLVAENYSTVPDLPSLAWQNEPLENKKGEEDVKVTFCPLADYWLEKGEEELGRIYCFVDQAKYKAYNPALYCEHEKNLLDGDAHCRIVVHREKNDEVK